MCVAFTGDGRPNSLTIKYAKGCDLLITEIQPEVISIGAVVSGAMPLVARNTIDQAHNPAYAAGYLYNQVKPRIAMGTHVSYDNYVIPEIIAEVREHWKGPFHLGAPDMVVVNMTKDKVWVRNGVVPSYPNMAPPQFDTSQQGDWLFPRRNISAQISRSSPFAMPKSIPISTIRRAIIPNCFRIGHPTTIFLPQSKVPETMKMKKK